jgi:hypothetical protein
LKYHKGFKGYVLINILLSSALNSLIILSGDQ